MARPRALPLSALCSEPENWTGLRFVGRGEVQLTPSALVLWLGLVGTLQGPGVERTLLDTLPALGGLRPMTQSRRVYPPWGKGLGEVREVRVKGGLGALAPIVPTSS